MNQIVVKEKLAPQINLIKLEVPEITRKAQPGQFVILRIHKEGERIPMSIADLEPENGLLTIIFQEVGKSTVQLGKFQKGEKLCDVVGPLGQPTHIEHYGKCICVGGGIGIAPIHPIAKALKQTGNEVISIIGARTKELLIMEEEMKKTSDELVVCTDDGSYGFNGFVTQPLSQLLKEGAQVDFCMVVGPVPMMKTACMVTQPYGIKTMVSLNPIMIDGTGMCGVCRVTVGEKTKFACVDGPDFDGHQVDFDELSRRLSMYVKQEKISLEKYLSLTGKS
ncbi:MAG: sulfide/dihydroorotate dehydrogenase-like FAD/NAD-binding protein [Candidatus Zixiibacteriota bacterium]